MQGHAIYLRQLLGNKFVLSLEVQSKICALVLVTCRVCEWLCLQNEALLSISLHQGFDIAVCMCGCGCAAVLYYCEIT